MKEDSKRTSGYDEKMNERNANPISLTVISVFMIIVIVSLGRTIVTAVNEPIEEYEPIYILEDGTPIYCCQIPIEHFYSLIVLTGVIFGTVGIMNLIDRYKDKKKID